MSSKPNLVFLFTDEQRFDTLAAYGNSQIEMPALNSFAEEATVFEQAYCTQPVCTPSRGSILCGEWPHQHRATTNNLHLSRDSRSIAEYLPRGQYACGYVGKWHLGDEIFPQHGFDEWVSIEDEYIPWYSAERDREARSSYYHHLERLGYQPADGSMYTRAQCARLPEDHGKPAFVADRAIDFIRRHGEQPFALVVNFLEPHMPFFGPRDGQYDPESLPLPLNFDAPRASRWQEASARDTYNNGQNGMALRSETDWHRMVANYWGLNSLIDTHVGRILQYLRDNELYDNSIIVFTSDHGDMMGSHRMIAKTVMYEESVRIPMLIKVPGQVVQQRVTNPVSQIDLVPTLLELMEIEPADITRLAGRSLVAATEGRQAPRDVLIQWNKPEDSFIRNKLFDGNEAGDENLTTYFHDLGNARELDGLFRAARRCLITADGRYKLVLSGDGEHMLFDLKEDPGESCNCISERPGTVSGLCKSLIDKMELFVDPALEEIVPRIPAAYTARI